TFCLATRRHPRIGSDWTTGQRRDAVTRTCTTRHRSQDMSQKLYVGNLPYDVGETALQELFARAGTVERVTVMRDGATGRGRGFAFVEMSTEDEAKTAIRELHDYQFGGRNVTVNEARPKPAGGFRGSDSRRRRSEPRW